MKRIEAQYNFNLSDFSVGKYGVAVGWVVSQPSALNRLHFGLSAYIEHENWYFI